MSFITKDSGKRHLFSTGMQRDIQEGKPRYDLVYIPMLTRWAELMARGAEKYGERNWEKAETQEEIVRFKASAFRHFIQWFNDEADEDHAAAVFFNIAGVEFVKNKLALIGRAKTTLTSEGCKPIIDVHGDGIKRWATKIVKLLKLLFINSETGRIRFPRRTLKLTQTDPKDTASGRNVLHVEGSLPSHKHGHSG